ncbi:MAG TPA: M50 family metallopeptidase [Clostridia bacterium]|nr:M50 family metallopeptidase [Clostridia bacterium]
MSTALYIIISLVILSIFVTLHELGHYVAGKALGFGIVEFAVGMGPALIKKKKNGIIYSLRAIPVGGMCRFYGEDEETGDGKAFGSQKPWKRAVVLASGALMNLLTAVVLAVIILTTIGIAVDYIPTVDSFTYENSPAQTAGLLPGDRIVAVDGHTLTQYDQINSLLSLVTDAAGDSCVVTVERDGQTTDVAVRGIYNEAEGRNILGIMIGAIPVYEKMGFFEAVGSSFQYIWQLVKSLFSFFGMLFRGEIRQGDVMGPVGIIRLIADAIKESIAKLLEIAVLISANLGLFNLLPLPALDGGRLVFVGLEAVRRKPIPAEKEGIVHFVGIVLLLGLIIYLTIGDISSWLGG